jgi:hypothetical protein
MENKKQSLNNRLLNLVICLALISPLIFNPWSKVKSIDLVQPVRRVNVPYLGVAPPVDDFTPAIFWFGKVTTSSNSTDVRIFYYDEYLEIVFHIIDRVLWYDTSPTPMDLTNWDAVTVYLNLSGNNGNTPGEDSYQFDGQLNQWEARDSWQAAYQGNGSNWISSPIAFTTSSFWRGDYPNNDIEDRGWSITFQIPFASLGLQTKPAQGTIWGLGAVLHDRDDAGGTPIPDQYWPENMLSDQPLTWAQMRFGLPGYNPPAAIVSNVVTISQDVNGAIVPDGEVGGHTTCGDGLWGDIWNNFGNANYNGYSQINIQNQWDISDFACFSKYYITFPLDSLPAGKVIISATLTLVEFGCSCCNSDPSYIQAATVYENWDEATLTWNSAPLPLENISGKWVYPEDQWVPYEWDVSRGVADAYANGGGSLRLALYSVDGNYSSGKYFWTSDAGMGVRPVLRVVLGDACNQGGNNCHFFYLPLIRK